MIFRRLVEKYENKDSHQAMAGLWKTHLFNYSGQQELQEILQEDNNPLTEYLNWTYVRKNQTDYRRFIKCGLIMLLCAYLL